MSRFRRHPSPALVVACIALAVALGGTSYAAIVLPANSVGTKQLVNGAVVAAKVKGHSLVAANFKAGELPPGPKGADGLAGAAGPTGPAGAKGDAATKLFATVKPKAGSPAFELGPSNGVVGAPAKGPGPGLYNVTFNQDVSNCAVLAIPGGKDLASGFATAQTTGGAGVTVKTFNSGGAPDDLNSFTVAIFC
jgi:hypothetical protein